jgi:hypothetical protein
MKRKEEEKFVMHLERITAEALEVKHPLIPRNTLYSCVSRARQRWQKLSTGGIVERLGHQVDIPLSGVMIDG